MTARLLMLCSEWFGRWQLQLYYTYKSRYKRMRLHNTLKRRKSWKMACFRVLYRGPRHLFLWTLKWFVSLKPYTKKKAIRSCKYVESLNTRWFYLAKLRPIEFVRFLQKKAGKMPSFEENMRGILDIRTCIYHKMMFLLISTRNNAL